MSSKQVNKEDIRVYGLLDGKRTIRYIPRNYPIPVVDDSLYKYKVFFPYAYGSGAFGETMPESILAKPGEACTETFLRMGCFDTEAEAIALSKYLKTKLCRAMIGILKNTQHSTTTYQYVPLQDFTPNSDIDWSKPIPEIDQQLYAKYGLSQDEIDFIEENVEEMD